MKRPGTTGERSLALFLLGLLLFSPPLLSLFNASRFVAGVPLLYLYLFFAWTALIALMALTATRSGRRARKERGTADTSRRVREA